MNKRLYRSKKNRILFGVCGGLGEYFDVDPVIIRIIAVLLLIPGVFPVILAYLIMAIIIPEEGAVLNTPSEVVRQNISDIKETAEKLGQEIQQTISPEQKAGSQPTTRTSQNRLLFLIGVIVISIGIIILLATVLGWLWRYLWPLCLIVAGLLIIFFSRRR